MACALTVLLGLASALAPTFWWLFVLRTLAGAAAVGIAQAAFLLGTEPVGPSWRAPVILAMGESCTVIVPQPVTRTVMLSPPPLSFHTWGLMGMRLNKGCAHWRYCLHELREGQHSYRVAHSACATGRLQQRLRRVPPVPDGVPAAVVAHAHGRGRAGRGRQPVPRCAQHPRVPAVAARHGPEGVPPFTIPPLGPAIAP